jgi:hypothetical protein
MDTPETLSLAAFAFSLTEMCKKLGVSGEYLTACSVAFGALGFFLQTYLPEWWLLVSQILVGATPAAAVSFVRGTLQPMKRPSE